MIGYNMVIRTTSHKIDSNTSFRYRGSVAQRLCLEHEPM